MSARDDIKNRIFNDVLVLEFHEEKNSHAVWKCLCMLCGEVFTSTASNLKSGNTKSCGSCGGKRVSNGLQQEIEIDLTKGLTVAQVTRKYNINRGIVYRIRDRNPDK